MLYIEHLGTIPKGHFEDTSLTFQPPFGVTVPGRKRSPKSFKPPGRDLDFDPTESSNILQSGVQKYQ